MHGARTDAEGLPTSGNQPLPPRLTDDEAAALFALLMVTDPWPLGDSDRRALVSLADKEAAKRGFDGWTAAYHSWR